MFAQSPTASAGVVWGDEYRQWQDTEYRQLVDDDTWMRSEVLKSRGFIEEKATVKAETVREKISRTDCPSDNYWACQAWDISNGNRDFFLTLSVESARTFDPWKKAYGAEPSWGFCQIHTGYHPRVYNKGVTFDWSGTESDIRENPSNMMQWCWREWSACYRGTGACIAPMYGYNVRNTHAKIYGL